MIIYHLFINGKYQFKTNSFMDVYDTINGLDHLDVVVSELVEKKEYHLYDSTGRRKVDIVVSSFG